MKTFIFWLDIYQLLNTVFDQLFVFILSKNLRLLLLLLLLLRFLRFCHQCKIDARWRIVHWFDNQLIPFANEHNVMQWSKWNHCYVCPSQSIFCLRLLFLLHANGMVNECAQTYTRNLLLLLLPLSVVYMLRCVAFTVCWLPHSFPLEQKPSNSYRIKKKFYHVNGVRRAYLPHSVAFCNGHSEAVAMNPWRRLSTRVLCSSPLQHGTMVPVPCVNGVVFVSFVPISVPVDV